MIFVTVGTDTHDFSRLVKAMDDIAQKRKVVMQIGHTQFRPQHAKWFSFESNAAIDVLYRDADIIVTHGGAGSIIRSLKEGKIPVVVPRLRMYGEHVNDHQRDLARSLSAKGKVVIVEDVATLAKSVRKRTHTFKTESELVRRLQQELAKYETS